ncbi:MAG: Type restriction enzyme protein terminus [Burkholderia sp.]|nr:Type restriction enzyme protein terminus [Burkholderia sp.]
MMHTRTVAATVAVAPELVALMSRASTSLDAGRPSALSSGLRQIADRIPRLRTQGARISEQDTKRILITPAIEALGGDSFDIDEVRNEYRHNSADNPVDYALFLNRSPVLFVEAKPLGHTLDDRKWIVQTINYANAAGVDWCVLTNGAEWRIYKVHAQVEADRKLFTTVTIEDTQGMNDAVRVLGLLSRENMRARAIDELWQAWHVDRQVQQALEQTLQDDAFATLLRRRIPQLSLADVRKSLRRANIAVSYPNIFSTVLTPPVIAEHRSELVAANMAIATLPVAQTAASQPEEPPTNASRAERAAGNESSIPRRRFQSTQNLFDLGRLKAGDTLTIKGRTNSLAEVVDGRSVEFRGEKMSFNDWGQRVTGWPSIRIYTMACLPDGKTLDQLRDQQDASSTMPQS